MTDKTELMPCPFCGNDVEFWAGGTAEFYGHDHQSMSIDCNKCGLSMALDTCMDKNGEISKGYEFGCSCCNDIPFILRKRWNTRAAPAEDVCAVGDEPDELDALWADAHYLCARVANGSLNATPVAERIRRSIESRPRHPQRPVVLPECTEESFNAAGFSRYDFWNVWRAAHKSFIAEYKRLNP